MKIKAKFVIVTTFAGFAVSAIAQNAQNAKNNPGTPAASAASSSAAPASGAKQTQQSSANKAAATQPNSAQEEASLADTSALLNKRITDKQGGELGQLERLLFDPASGRVRYGVVEVNKAWNLKDPKVVVPWGAFLLKKQGATDYQVQLDTTRDKLEKAQKFEPNNLDQLAKREAGQPIYAYWAVIWIDEGPVTPANTSSTGENKPAKAGTETTRGSSTSAAQPGTNSSTSGNQNSNTSTKQTGAQQ